MSTERELIMRAKFEDEASSKLGQLKSKLGELGTGMGQLNQGTGGLNTNLNQSTGTFGKLGDAIEKTSIRKTRLLSVLGALQGGMGNLVGVLGSVAAGFGTAGFAIGTAITLIGNFASEQQRARKEAEAAAQAIFYETSALDGLAELAGKIKTPEQLQKEVMGVYTAIREGKEAELTATEDAYSENIKWANSVIDVQIQAGKISKDIGDAERSSLAMKLAQERTITYRNLGNELDEISKQRAALEESMISYEIKDGQLIDIKAQKLRDLDRTEQILRKRILEGGLEAINNAIKSSSPSPRLQGGGLGDSTKEKADPYVKATQEYTIAVDALNIKKRQGIELNQKDIDGLNSLLAARREAAQSTKDEITLKQRENELLSSSLDIMEMEMRVKARSQYKNYRSEISKELADFSAMAEYKPQGEGDGGQDPMTQFMGSLQQRTGDAIGSGIQAGFSSDDSREAVKAWASALIGIISEILNIAVPGLGSIFGGVGQGLLAAGYHGAYLPEIRAMAGGGIYGRYPTGDRVLFENGRITRFAEPGIPGGGEWFLRDDHMRAIMAEAVRMSGAAGSVTQQIILNAAAVISGRQVEEHIRRGARSGNMNRDKRTYSGGLSRR